MAVKPVIAETKPDGRLYSRITRRTAAIISHIRRDRVFTVSEIAEEINAKELPEFFLERFNRPMSVGRIRDYVRYLNDLAITVQQEDKYVLNFRHRSTDEEWAQALSDQALLHLAKTLNKKPDKIPDYLESLRVTLHKAKRVPTLHALVASTGIEGGRGEETIKWSLWIYADGEACPFDVRRYPVLVTRGLQGG